jgi:hypothetical protein
MPYPSTGLTTLPSARAAMQQASPPSNSIVFAAFSITISTPCEPPARHSQAPSVKNILAFSHHPDAEELHGSLSTAKN